ncbi:Uncharacterised protein [Chryseobacterium nakagawai]|uniref:Uncharacterized protein n=1 Tax=Chryseobacterium nakagawai TaxID=1241982 RepID=A0AAD0YM67_CHRNA|nr:hypothetical protein [Chryseobacterium nakagawai]AZA93056.1 hypothetical protein EG343_21850 [Chryseobacterium nakagawai]VEH19689.1 Uncharacterised protein [Chryseobacterium nakagawai]
MEIYFYTNNNKVLNLSGQKISVRESNYKISKAITTKFTFPFEFYMDEEFLLAFGDFVSLESSELDSIIDGHFLFESKLYEAKLTFLSTEGNFMTAQIDYGFEELPNWNKKLSDLQWDKIDVLDIHKYAQTVCGKTYPEVYFNFPRIFTKKFNNEDKVWDAFNGYYNNLNEDGSEMIRNYVDASGNIFNVNIIHPCIYYIYLLKKCFSDIGLQLQGDILTDTMFKDAYVFSGTDYFNKKDQFFNNYTVSVNEIDSVENIFWYGEWSNGWHFDYRIDKQTYIDDVVLNFTDKLYINGRFYAKVMQKTTVKMRIQLNGNDIWSHEQYCNEFMIIEKPFTLGLNIDNATVRFIIEGCLSNFSEGYNVIQYELKSNSIIQNGSSSQSDDAVIENSNLIDLKRAVPDMTVGDLMKIHQSWFNYEFKIVDNVVWMNRLGDKDPENVKDFQVSEIQKPKRILLEKKSYSLKHLDLDDFKMNSFYYDKNGGEINKEGNKNTEEIEINGYSLPVEKSKTNGYMTASVKTDNSSCLSLVFYRGIDSAGQNNAIHQSNVSFPELFYSNWEKWLRQRVKGYQYTWNFQIPADELKVKVDDFIGCYNNIHIITDWTKDLQENTYNIEITTETSY